MSTDFTRIIDSEGVLLPIEFSKLPFVPKRVFYVTNVPVGIKRGNHAHYNTQQMLFCVKGRILVNLFNGRNTTKVTLHEGDSTFADKLVWDSQTFLTPDAVLLSICSTEYDPDDYIEDLDEFKQIANNTT